MRDSRNDISVVPESSPLVASPLNDFEPTGAHTDKVAQTPVQVPQQESPFDNIQKLNGQNLSAAAVAAASGGVPLSAVMSIAAAPSLQVASSSVASLQPASSTGYAANAPFIDSGAAIQGIEQNFLYANAAGSHLQQYDYQTQQPTMYGPNVYYQAAAASQSQHPNNAELIQHHQQQPLQAFQNQLISPHQITPYGEQIMDQEGRMPAPTRASPLTIQWLLDNYETADGVSLPRSTMYCHYLQHCKDQKIDPMNPASFGKLIRSVFLGLRTRRLGTRGHSKYHYYGIRIKATSPLNNLSEENVMSYMRTQFPSRRGNSVKAAQGGAAAAGQAHSGGEGSSQLGVADQVNIKQEGPTLTSLDSRPQGMFAMQVQHQPSAMMLELFKSFPPLTLSASFPSELCYNHFAKFEEVHNNLCSHVCEAVQGTMLSNVETIWLNFWQEAFPDNPATYADSEENSVLTKRMVISLVGSPEVQEYMEKVDFIFYQRLVDVLISDVLRSIQSNLTQSIRNFAKSLEGWMRTALNGYPESFVQLKVSTAIAFGQMLRRYTSLNHLAQAARAVLQNTQQISQMLADLNRVDFGNVHEQAAWICQCDANSVLYLGNDFKKTLGEQSSLEKWAQWLDGVVASALAGAGGDEGKIVSAARHLMLAWSFYSSLVIRDLTLRSAASFGSFHLIHLLFDEYTFYLIERKVAVSLKQPALQIMSKLRTKPGDGLIRNEGHPMTAAQQAVGSVATVPASVMVVPSASGGVLDNAAPPTQAHLLVTGGHHQTTLASGGPPNVAVAANMGMLDSLGPAPPAVQAAPVDGGHGQPGGAPSLLSSPNSRRSLTPSRALSLDPIASSSSLTVSSVGGLASVSPNKAIVSDALLPVVHLPTTLDSSDTSPLTQVHGGVGMADDSGEEVDEDEVTDMEDEVEDLVAAASGEPPCAKKPRHE